MTTQSKRTVAFALCGSFCSFAAVLPQLRVLTARGWDVLITILHRDLTHIFSDYQYNSAGGTSCPF